MNWNEVKIKFETVTSPTNGFKCMICAETKKKFSLHAFQGFGRQQDKIPHEFHLSVVQFSHSAVSIQQ